MKISKWRPRMEPKWERDQHGSRVARIETEEGVVDVYSFPGDAQQAAFTTLTLWISPHRYQATLKRHYHDRWIRRIAYDFSWQCSKLAEAS